MRITVHGLAALLLAGLLTGAVLACVCVRDWRVGRKFSGALLAAWATAVIWITLLSREPVPYPRVHLTLLSYWHPYEFVENTVLFLPLGFLLCMTGLRAGGSILLGTGLSVFIELTQLATGRGILDLQDLLANTVGAALGAAGFALLCRMWRKNLKNIADDASASHE